MSEKKNKQKDGENKAGEKTKIDVKTLQKTDRQSDNGRQNQHHPHQSGCPSGFWFNKEGTCPVFM